ncbi:hypothetical protein Pyrde_1816 [Pyrodictium delaneyi]|uniref:SpoVT-AbrB domain-containing protein n=1 Tax=Pyrodictium delaneyi TaxID=1273541 RepID=A0A0P0N565_9CREN|nr:hypothetical protein Pyrde_1816 [Pyrodictium delaneyi]
MWCRAVEAIVKDRRTIILSEEAAQELGLEPGERLVVRREGRRVVLERARRGPREAEERRRRIERLAGILGEASVAELRELEEEVWTSDMP